MQFQTSKEDSSLFFKKTSTGNLFILVYVDGIIVTRNSCSELYDVIQHLDQKFALNDLGELSFFLGLEVVRRDGYLHVSQ